LTKKQYFFSELPPLPRLKRKPQSPRSGSDDVTMDKLLGTNVQKTRQKYSPDSTTKDPLDTHPSDDDYNPYTDDGQVFL